jgi:hypothetical protein
LTVLANEQLLPDGTGMAESDEGITTNTASV